MSITTPVRTICDRHGGPLSERDIRARHTWCADCRWVDADHYTAPPKREATSTSTKYPPATELVAQVEACGLRATAQALGVTHTGLAKHLQRQARCARDEVAA